MSKRSRLLVFGIMAFAVTAFLAVLALNFSAGDKPPDQQLPRLYGAKDPQFKRVMGSLLRPGIVGGNKVDELINGDQIFPAMLGAIKGARSTVNFETYTYWSGDIGKAFADALAERATKHAALTIRSVGLGSILQKSIGRTSVGENDKVLCGSPCQSGNV